MRTWATTISSELENYMHVRADSETSLSYPVLSSVAISNSHQRIIIRRNSGELWGTR